MVELLFADESYRIRGACFEVYREKGCGFVELVYQQCLEAEFQRVAIPYAAHPRFGLDYKGRPLTVSFEPDFVCYDRIVLEIKAVAVLTDSHRAQLHNYLKVTERPLGLLVNFGHYPHVEIERIIRERR